MVPFPGVGDALRQLAVRFRIHLVTNQSGIGRGYYTMADAEACNRRMLALMGLPSDFLAGICIAPERPDEPSAYRKPSPRYLLETIARDGLQPDVCWMAGDRLSDLQCGVAAGVRTALIRTTEHSDTPDIRAFVREHALPSFSSFPDFAAHLLSFDPARPPAYNLPRFSTGKDSVQP